MLPRGQGRIVNMASVAGLNGTGGGAAYIAAKHGVVGLTRQMAVVYSPRGITVNCVCPGPILTNLRQHSQEILGPDVPDMSGRGVAVNDDQVRGLVPLGRRGTVEDIASAVCYLASDEAGYITGHAHGRGRRLESQMITKFSVLYVGQIELDNVGLQGTPADDRRYANERLAEAFHTAKDVAQQMDELGYYCLWTAEHHFQREGYEVFPNLILLGTWLATQTQRLKFGCAFNILPMWHPLRLAEDYAFADIVTGGPRHHGRRPGLPHARGGDLRRADAGQQGQPGALRGADGGSPQGVQRGVVLPSREALHDPAGRRVPRLQAGATSPSSRGPSTGRWRSGSPSPPARRCPTSPSAASRAW